MWLDLLNKTWDQSNKMADPGPARKMDLTMKHLGYNSSIHKIPEYCKVDVDNFDESSCLNSYKALHVQEDLFKIIGELYDVIDLCAKVLDHIKKNGKYYGIVVAKYLWSKKLDLVIWLADMLHFDIPADELCLHACGLFLNIHITVNFHFGHWTTLDVPGISHDLVVIL